MGVFWFLICFLFVVKLVSQRTNNRLFETMMGALGCWAVLALRSPYCGVDLLQHGISYYYIFHMLNDSSWSQTISLFNYMESGWVVYCYFVSLFTNSFNVFLAITALIQIIPIAIVFYYYSKDISFSYLIYICLGLYVFSFSGLRQTIAISMVLFAFLALQKDKKWLFVLLVLLASSFHRSSIIFLFIIFLNKKTLSFKRSVFLLLVLFLSLPFLHVIINFLTSLLFPRRYTKYENEGGAITMFIVYIVLLLLSYLNKTENKNIHFFRWMILCCVGCQSLGIISTGAMTRIGFYFSIFFPLLLPEIPAAFEKKSALIVNLIACIALIAFFYLTTKDGYLNVVPYYFAWEKPL